MDYNKRRYVRLREMRGRLHYWIMSLCICLVSLGLYHINQTSAQEYVTGIAYNKAQPVIESEVKDKPVIEKKSDNPIDFKALRAQNEDVYAWLKVKGTKIDYPVMFSADEDIDYYLSHSWLKEADKHGSIYIRGDAHNNLRKGFTIIYGHNMLDGSMFSGLKSIDKNSTNKIVLYTENAKFIYKIIKVESIDDNLKTVEDLKRVAGSSYSKKKAYIALSTCTGLSNIRKIVYAECVKVKGC